MTSKRGRFVAVNYVDSELNLEPVLTFFRSMNFDVTVRPDKSDDPPLTYERSIDLFRTIASLDYFPNLHSASCLVLCIFAHVGDHLDNAYPDGPEVRRDSIRCADNRHLPIQQLVDCFNDPYNIGCVTLAARLPIFFFINHYHKNDDQETKQVESNSPYLQIVKKNHFFICHSTYTKSWLPRRLKALYRASGDERYNLGDSLKTEIIESIRTFTGKRPGLKENDYLRLSNFETTEFWRLLWNCTNNSFDENVDDDEVAPNESMIYDISSSDRDSVSTSRPSKSGFCLILNYKTKQDDSTQSYAENDQSLMASVFKRFNFVVQIEEALTANATKEVLEEESQNGNLYSALALVIIAGTMTKAMYDVSGDDEIECAKRETYPIADVLKHFGDDTNWAGKPKLFFIMHWDGWLEKTMLQTLFYKMNQTNYLDKSTTFDFPKDSLFFLSSRIAIDKGNQNSNLINEISSLMKKYGKCYDVMTILQQLNFGSHFTSKRFYSDNLRNFLIRSSLRKLLFLSPKNDLREYIASISVPSQLHGLPGGYDDEIGPFVRIFSYSIQDLRLPINITIDITANRVKQRIENLENHFNMMKFSNKLGLGSSSTWTDLLKAAYWASKKFTISSNTIERSCIVCFITILNHLNLNSEEVEKENNKLFQQLYYALRPFFIDNREQAYQRLPIFILVDYHLAKPKSLLENLTLSSLPTSNASCNFSQYFSNLSMCGNIFFSFTQKSCIDNDINNDDRRQSHRDSTQSNVSEICGIKLKDNENCITFSNEDMDVPYDKNFAPTVASMIDDDRRDSSIYEMRNMNRGLCIVLSYVFEIKSEFWPCQNLYRDTSMLEFTFCSLGFRVESFRDLSAVQTQNFLRHVAQDDHWSDACLVLCLITRYENGYFYCSDLKINLESTLKMFDSNESLSGKPKIIFIEDPYQNRRIMKPDVDVLDSLRPTRINTLPPDFIFIQTLHFEENFPYHLKTFLNDFYDKNGSWFIRSLFEKLPDFAHCVDFLTILRSICSNGFASPNFVRKFWLNYKALPNIHIKSTLRRRLIFEPEMNRYANFSKINREFRDPMDAVEIGTFRDALFYNREGKGRVLVVKPIVGGRTQPITPVDEELQKLREVFEKLEFDFEVRLIEIGEEETNRKSIMNFLQEESQRNHNQYNCLILFILLDQKQLLPIDFDQDMVIENFTKHWSLIGKPKLIFVLGEMSETTIVRARNFADSDQSMKNRRQNSFRIPKFSDLMLFRCDFESDIVIKCFTDLLRSYANTLHVTTILTILLQDIALFCPVVQDNSQNRVHITLTFSRLFYIGFDLPQISDESYQAQLQLPIANFFPNKNKRNLFIFNHEIYDKSKESVCNLERRKGTSIDVATLRTVFEALNFNIEPTFQDLTVDRARMELKKIKETDFTECDCIALCYLSHGIEKGVLYCHDGEINLNDIVRALSENQSLIDKPKLIFVQACRGNRVDSGVLVTDEDGSFGVTLPSYSQPELFIFSSSYPGHRSFRDADTGSWFVNALGETLIEHYVRHDLATIAAFVCRKVALRSDDANRCKQTPVVHSTLSKLFYFENLQKNDN